MNRCTRCGATSTLARCPICGSMELAPLPTAAPATATTPDDLFRPVSDAGASVPPLPATPPLPPPLMPPGEPSRAFAPPPAYAAVPPAGLPPQAPAGFPASPAPSLPPGPPRSGKRTGIILGCLAGAVVVLALVLAYVLGAFNGPRDAVAPAPQAPSTPTASTSPGSSIPTSISSSTAPAPTSMASTPRSAPTSASTSGSVITDPSQAQAELTRLADTGRAQVSFDGRWVAQLASKYDGVTDPQLTAMNGSHTFRFPDILNEHLTLQRSAPAGTQVVLLRSTDYGKRSVVNGQPLWVTMALRPEFTSEAAVQSWCAQRYPAVSGKDLKNICMPNRLNP